jgi:hypothetical protein
MIVVPLVQLVPECIINAQIQYMSMSVSPLRTLLCPQRNESCTCMCLFAFAAVIACTRARGLTTQCHDTDTTEGKQQWQYGQ